MGWKIMPAGRVRKAARTKDAKAILDRLRTYLDEKSWEPIRILHGFWQNQQKAITYQELRELVRQGYLDEVTARLWQQDYSMLVKTQMPKIWGSAMIAGSVSQPVMESILPAFELNMQTPGVVRWIRSRGAALVTVSTQTQKDAISLLLEEKIRQKYTVDELARLIRPTIGLYRQQTAAVERYYDKMVQSLTKDHPRTKPQVIRQRALTQATKYAERLHRQRAITIAQTEMAFAYNFGADEGIRQAQADFLIGKVEKRWCTSGDDRVCPECSALDGRQIGMDELFFSGNRVEYDESGLYPPLHPRCACAVQYVEVEAPRYLLSKDNDPLYEALGPICKSNPEEMKFIKEEAQKYGVEIREDSKGMAYAPGLRPGDPGQLIISIYDSLGAWRHEEQHMLDDMKDGWPGFPGIFDIDRRSRMEYTAYKREIKLARSIGREDIAQKLIEQCRKEIESFGANWDEKQLE